MSNHLLKPDREPVLTDDQQGACERLLALALVRANTTEAALPRSVLNRWSVPLLIGPAGSGKTFVCEEVGHRWNGKPCRRWEVASWITHSNRNRPSTLDQIQAFVASNPAGGVVYLAGIDALGVEAGHSASYYRAVAAEITQLLDGATARPAYLPGREGAASSAANVLVVVGGCFAALWGDPSIGGPAEQEDWRLADRDALTGAEAVATWLRENSRLPADILRRLPPEPLILQPINQRQTEQLAVRLRDNLPPSLDGLGVEEFNSALQSPHGWRAVAALIEQAWVDGHQHLPTLLVEVATPATMTPASALPGAKPLTAPPPVRLGERLGIASNRSRLLAQARRLGLCTAWDLEKLAIARGYCLLGEQFTRTTVTESVERVIFTDTELLTALLSPCLEMSERAILRGTLILAMQLPLVYPEAIVYEARLARGETIVRHVARLGVEICPQQRRWRDLLLILPTAEATPALAPGIMPDEAIRRVLSATRL